VPGDAVAVDVGVGALLIGVDGPALDGLAVALGEVVESVVEAAAVDVGAE